MKRTMIMLMMALIVSGLTGKLSAQEENKEIRIKLKVEDAGNGEVIILDTSLIGDEQGTRVHTLRNIRIDKGEGEMRFEVAALIDSVLETLEWTELPEGSSEEREKVIVRKSGKGDPSIIMIKMHKASLMKMDEDDLEIFAPILKKVGVSSGPKADFLEMEFYPNPSDGLFNLELKPIGKESIQIEVFDLEGRKIISKEMNQNIGKFKTQLDMRGHSPGTYLLVIRQGSNCLSRKVVLQE